jgi:nuclear protein localization family protein 4
MIVRLRSPEGVERVVVKPEDDVCVLYKSYSAKKNVVLSYRPNDKNFLPLSGASLSKLGIKNGDMLFIDYHKDNSANDVMPLCDDDIDKILSKRSGEIKRGKGSSCRHGDNAMCDNCMPLPPYDENYTKEKKIKHLSIHSYIRKLMSSKSDVDVVLEEPSFLVNAKCQSGHAPFPKSMCAKCQPSGNI